MAEQEYSIGLIPEAVAAVLVDDVKATKNMKKYKRSMKLPTGQKVNVRWDGEAFYYRDQSGGKVLLMPPSVRSYLIGDDRAEDRAEVERMFAEAGGTTTRGMVRHHRALQAENRTGNHTARNHFVGVPTKPGEPVRG